MTQIVNTDQAQAWNGYEGEHWARNQQRWDTVNEGFNEPLLTAATIAEADRILDVGCGAGRTTRLAAQRAPHGHALGLDLSAPMLERARATARAESIDNVGFEQGDAQVHPLQSAAFDVAISRYGVMFFADPAAAFTNVARALRPGGRVAFICAADPGGNDWVRAIGALRAHLPVGDFTNSGGPGMFSLADPDRIHAVLTSAGFADVRSERLEVQANWGPDAADVASFLLNSGPGRYLTSEADQETRVRAREALTDFLRMHEADGQVRLRSTAWLVTARRPR
ncbi:SAM-dependent methyltransferase [Streptacidiphilus sp. MAP12-16]|uniref:class I SAM-dependent methyltransferase n=1 Tax=Streptacidiphilus sp. MAP12-16 TaxID=3156300 RepID=UPI00351632D3